MPAAAIIAAGAAVVGAGAAVVGTVNTAKAQKKANKAAKQQYAYERQIQQNNAVRQRRDAIRAGRMASANVLQTSVNTGGDSSSAALGSLGSIQSQLDSNLSFLDTQNTLATKAGDQSEIARAANANAQKWSGITQLGMAIFNNSDEIGAKFK